MVAGPRRGRWTVLLFLLFSIASLSWYISINHLNTYFLSDLPTPSPVEGEWRSSQDIAHDIILPEHSQVTINETARPPKITVIGIWGTRDSSGLEPNYMPAFFQSVEANPQINLLFINIDLSGTGCSSHSKAANVKEVCLSEKRYHELHVEFLCKRWRCTEADQTLLLQHLLKQATWDVNHSFFRILRSGIFAQWLHPDTTIWGWCDFDEYWGSFERIFPWDIAADFDVIAIKSQPDYRDQQLLFTRGHMAFFRHSPDMLEKLHAYPTFDSMATYLLSPNPRHDAEESEFSHHLFVKNDNITYLHIEGMVDAYDAVVSSVDGTFYFNGISKDAFPTADDRKSLLKLVRPRDRRPVFPTFTDHPVEPEREVEVKNKDFNGFYWFPEEFVAYIDHGWDGSIRGEKAFFMRRERRGPVTQRLEPRDRFLQVSGNLKVDEVLYQHFQREKRRAWFKRIPAKAWRSADTYFQWRGDEAEIWDTDGNIVFATGKDGDVPGKQRLTKEHRRLTA